MRILVIDDDPATGDMFEACLAAHPPADACEAVHASSDELALELLQGAEPFDLAVVSIDGGAVSGLSIFQQLMTPALRIPRVALTAGGNIEPVRAAVGDGAADLLVKPLEGASLADTISRVMQRVERRRQSWNERAAYMALRREVDMAADMQRRILPRRLPQRAQLEMGSLMRPARGIGGDFYDLFEIDDHRVGALIADVSGKGVPAAFYMAIASTALRSVGSSGAAPGACLAEVNEFLIGRDIPGMFVSVFYAVIDTESWEVRAANAGHPPPLLSVNGGGRPGIFECAGGPVMGILSGVDYAESAFALAPGAALVLYTDGVTEAMDPSRRQFGEARLAGALDCAGPSGQLISALEAALAAFTAGADQHDDMTALAVRRAR